MSLMKLQPWKRLLVGLILGIVTHTTCAASMSLPFSGSFKDSFWHPVLTLTAGGARQADLWQANNLPAHGGSFTYYNYTGNYSSSTEALFGIFAGAEFTLFDGVIAPAWSMQSGIGYYQPSSFTVNGTVTQGIVPSTYDEYSYQYDVHTSQLLFENKLLYNYQRYHPYFLIGLGIAFNRSENFNVDIQPPLTAFSNEFGSYTKRSFTYSLGFGLDVDLGYNTRLGLGYRYLDLGMSQTGVGVISTTTTDNVLAQTHLYANELVAQFTYSLI